MISPKEFTNTLIANNLGPVVEVPCSYFKDFLNYLWESKEIEIINPANEALVIGIASGYYLSTGQIPVVAIQNSGLMNTFNALTSLNQIYDIPLFMMVTWRGEGGIGKDAPEHDITGGNLEEILATFRIPYKIIDEKNYRSQIKELAKTALSTKKPVCLVIRKHTFEPYKKMNSHVLYEMNRLDAISTVKNSAKDALFISSTGFPTRDSYAAGDTSDFYIVGSMGHTLSIALGVAANTTKKVIALEGDGSFLMHLGGMASFDFTKYRNLIYIILDNEVYESTGGQPTAGSDINFEKIASSFGFKQIYKIEKKLDLQNVIKKAVKTDDSFFIHVKIALGEGKGARRVSDDYSCPQIKDRFMNKIV